MNRIRHGALLWLAASVALWPVRAQEKTPPLVIRGATVIDGTGAPPRGVETLLLDDGKIEAIGGKEVKVPPAAKEINAQGKFIIPSLLDARVRIGPTPGNHVSRSEIGIEQRLDSLAALLRAGVSTARLIQGSLLEQELYQRWSQDNLLLSPRIITSGPVFTGKGGHPIEEYSVLAVDARDREIRQISDDDQARERAREVAHADANSFEIIYDSGPRTQTKPRLAKSALEILVAEAHGHDLPVVCEVGWSQEAADAAGVGVNAVGGVWEEVLSDEALALLAKNHVTFIPALTQQGDLLNLLGEKELKAYLEDPLVQGSLSNIMKRSLEDKNGVIQKFRSTLDGETGPLFRRLLEEQQKRAFENVRKAKAAGIKIAMGTGAGNLLIFPGASAHRELQLLVKAGLTPMEAIVAATQNTADLLGKGAEYGTIEPGKAADLLILDADPLVDIRNTEKLQTVIHNGREVSLEGPPAQ